MLEAEQYPRAGYGEISVDQEKAMKTSIWLSIVLSIAAFTAGCNTMHGAGQDIERGGEKIQESAR